MRDEVAHKQQLYNKRILVSNEHGTIYSYAEPPTVCNCSEAKKKYITATTLREAVNEYLILMKKNLAHEVRNY